MNKKDFYIGKNVCVKKFANRYQDSEELQEWEITKIGRLYVTAKRIGTEYEVQFEIEDGYEKNRNRYRLYLSKQHILNLEEVYELKKWFRDNFNSYNSNCKYSLESLKKAKKILEDSVM